jgi:hypothetical protein
MARLSDDGRDQAKKRVISERQRPEQTYDP